MVSTVAGDTPTEYTARRSEARDYVPVPPLLALMDRSFQLKGNRVEGVMLRVMISVLTQ